MLRIDKASRPLLAAAGLSGAAGVALAAAASHAGIANLAIAATFLQLHAPALLVIGLVAGRPLLRVSGYVLIAGLLLFIGDLIMRAQFASPLFPFAAPLGGGLLIAGWLLVVASALFDGGSGETK